MTFAEKLKAYSIDHWLVLPLFLVGVFASSTQSIPLATVFYFPLLLHYTRKQGRNILIASVVNLLTLWISILGFPDGLESVGRFQRPGVTLVVALGAAINVCIPVAADFLASRQQDYVAVRVLVFPLLFTGVWLALFGHLMGAGDILTYSNSIITGFPDIVQAAVWFAGRPAVDFLLTLFATIVQEFGRTFEKPAFNNNSADNADEEQEELMMRPTTATSKKWLWHPATWYAAVLSLLSIVGGWQINIHRGSLFQVAYPDYVPETVPVGCVIGPSSIDWQRQAEHDRWLNRSRSLANAGAKLILWSEETASVSSPEEEASLLEKTRALAVEKQVYLTITYDKGDGVNILENKLVLITPKGEIAIDYNKAHPVPFVEEQPAGEEEIQYLDTPEFGRVGAAICFDYNFPWFIRQASKHNVDVMLQATWTWGPIGTYHSRSNSLRAVENGITVLRCGSQSLSGVNEPTLNGIFSQQVAVTNDAEYLFYLPTQKSSKTLYGFTGDLFGFSCLALGSAATLYLIYDAAIKYRRGGQIQV